MTQTNEGGGPVAPTDGERAFADRIAVHWRDVHGVTVEMGRMMGWMMICDPPEQTVSEICAAVDVRPEQIEPMIDHFVEAGMYERIERPGAEAAVRMQDDGYPRVVAQTFASWPDYHEVMRYGLRVLDDVGATPDRRRRLAELEALYRSVVGDLAGLMKTWNESVKHSVA
ncbi:hypothetical protein ACWF94_25525 [Streptomyces sp. NPDC055078]